MQVRFKSRDPQAAPLRDVVERRVRFVLRRISGRVPRAEVQFSDVNGPRGGVDKRCQIELRTAAAGPVVVSSIAKTWRGALDRALSRAARLVLRLWQRIGADRRLRRRLIEQEP
jgi:hypothetical protein